MHALLCAQFNQIVLIELRKARPNKKHVANQNAPQLRQLVEVDFLRKKRQWVSLEVLGIDNPVSTVERKTLSQVAIAMVALWGGLLVPTKQCANCSRQLVPVMECPFIGHTPLRLLQDLAHASLLLFRRSLGRLELVQAVATRFYQTAFPNTPQSMIPNSWGRHRQRIECFATTA